MRKHLLRLPPILARLAGCQLMLCCLGCWLPSWVQAQSASQAQTPPISARPVADFQRDPVRLVKEFSRAESTRDLPFNLLLTAEHVFGAERWGKLDDKQRIAVGAAFERTVNGMWETWDNELPLPVRVLKQEVQGKRTVLTVLRGEALFRFTLVQRDGIWFITEHEIADDALPEFADALQGALRPEARRGRIYDVSFEEAFKSINQLIATDGESAELLLLKARVLSSQQAEEESVRLMERLRAQLEARAQARQALPEQPAPVKRPLAEPGADQVVELLKRIVSRWPDFTPAYLALGRELLYSNNADEVINPLSKDTQQAVAMLQQYAKLAPYDPRPWRDLATAFEQLERDTDAEIAYRAAIERDRSYLDHHAALVKFLLGQEALSKAKQAFAQLLKAAEDPDDAFDSLIDDDEGFDPDSAKLFEELLLAFPKELAASKAGLSLLAEIQEAQNKLGDAIKSVLRAIAIEAEADDYLYLSQLYREQRRFSEALNAANQALKLDAKAAGAYFERACAQAQLGHKREALADLKQMLALDAESFFDLDEPDLQPLAALPEFKALKEKLKEAAVPDETKGAQPQAAPKKP